MPRLPFSCAPALCAHCRQQDPCPLLLLVSLIAPPSPHLCPTQVVSGLEELLSNTPPEEGEAAGRALSGLALLAGGDKDVAALMRDMGLGGVAAQWAGNAKAAAAAMQLQQALR